MNAVDLAMLRRFFIETNYPVAATSPDHLVPHGTRCNNSRNSRFNRKLEKWLSPASGEVLRVLDLGCSGGGFVRDCLELGWLSFGVEGSDFSKRFQRAEWATIPQFLFTADVTRPFDIYSENNAGSKEHLLFDVITAWEVMEHIHERDLPALCDNILRHLAPCGIWIASVSPNSDVVLGAELHQTIQSEEWWKERMGRLGFQHHPDLINYFNGQYIRGHRFGAPNSFHLALSRKGEKLSSPPFLSMKSRLFDAWNGCYMQRMLRELING